MKFNEWMVLRESILWEKHRELPSIFKRTYYALPTAEQLEEFQKYPNLSVEDIVQGFGYTIIGRGVRSDENCQKIIESIKMLIEKYPEQQIYKEALAKAQKDYN